MGNVKCCS